MSCPFAHSESELREAPSLKATGLCYEFARSGHCRRGEGCHFAHGQHELRSLPTQGAPALSFVPQTSQTNLQSVVKKLHHLEEMVGRMMREVHMAQQHMAAPVTSVTPGLHPNFILLSHHSQCSKCFRTEISSREPVSIWL